MKAPAKPALLEDVFSRVHDTIKLQMRHTEFLWLWRGCQAGRSQRRASRKPWRPKGNAEEGIIRNEQ